VLTQGVNVLTLQLGVYNQKNPLSTGFKSSTAFP
jgi:hypothetical protein